MSREIQSIEVTDRFTGWAAGFKYMGLSWAFRVLVGEEEVTGAVHSQAAAWREARAIKQRLIKLHRGQSLHSYRDWVLHEERPAAK